ncbi:MAG: histidinol phosphate phosphatase domain-containing protein [Desulfobacterales bacterium]|nr:histidinol phosphate phosphatase domain-containing protein [Desulfobacterales bacterium]
MIDLHTHSLFSDGELIPAELVRRFEVAGYRALAITDHGDQSNIDLIIPRLVAFCEEINRLEGIRVIPGIELTHIRPEAIPALVSRSRKLGARLVVVHGETIVEPVAPRTNRMAIESSVDILAHPGLITEEEVLLAKEHSVYLELTSRKGHSLTNGHVAKLAHRMGAPMILNSDAHAPGDIWSVARLHEIVVAAGLTEDDYHTMMKNAESIAKRCLA